MKSTQSIAEAVYNQAVNKQLTRKEKIKTIENFISWHINDILKLIKNINETSVNKQDRIDRIYQAEKEYGIPKTHLL